MMQKINESRRAGVLTRCSQRIVDVDVQAWRYLTETVDVDDGDLVGANPRLLRLQFISEMAARSKGTLSLEQQVTDEEGSRRWLR
jgi:hypothetical protein